LGEGPGAPQRVVQQTVKTFADAVGGKGDIVNGEVFTSGGTISQSNAADPRRWAKVRDAYVGADDKTLLYNQRMRAGGKLTGGAARHARDMRWLTEQGSFSTDATVYRGAILNDAQVSQLQAGFTLTDKAPMSTGFSQDVAEFYAKERRRDGASGETVIFKIQARAGQHAADVSGEIVLPPGSSLTVQNVTRRADGVLEVLAWLA